MKAKVAPRKRLRNHRCVKLFPSPRVRYYRKLRALRDKELFPQSFIPCWRPQLLLYPHLKQSFVEWADLCMCLNLNYTISFTPEGTYHVKIR